MSLITKKISSLILGITALICSRAMFTFIDDPEGPNLLIVVVLASIVYTIASLAVHFIAPLISGLKKILSVIFVQVLLVTIFYFFLK